MKPAPATPRRTAARSGLTKLPFTLLGRAQVAEIERDEQGVIVLLTRSHPLTDGIAHEPLRDGLEAIEDQVSRDLMDGVDVAGTEYTERIEAAIAALRAFCRPAPGEE